MANNTPNLELYKVDPITDGDKTFNVTTMLNENWDKIDRAAADWGTAKILPAKAFKAEDEGGGYPKGVSMFYLDYDGMDLGWPVNNGQVITFVTGKNRVSQMVFETNIATQRIWTRRWSSTQKAWSAFLEQETTAGSAEKVAQALKEAKAYTDEKASDAPVKSVNGKTGDVALTAADVGAAPKEHKHDASDITTGTMAAARLPAATTTGHGVVRLYDGVDGLAPNYSAASPVAVKQVYDELLLVKQSVVDGKGVIAEAINGKGGGPVSAYSTFPELAAGVNRIQTGVQVTRARLPYKRITTPSDSFVGKSDDAIIDIPAGAKTASFFTVRDGGVGTYVSSHARGCSTRARLYIRDTNGREVDIAYSETSNTEGSLALYGDSYDILWMIIDLERQNILYRGVKRNTGTSSSSEIQIEVAITSLNVSGGLQIRGMGELYERGVTGNTWGSASASVNWEYIFA
ncbi:hypothetical protein J27TS7_11090 [Paenibacillus dendritiformis]|uniref:hypothetical protein n=1 Tax=Paenibacillus dendritiformis TaxID=130049 RepID=UPI001B265A9A|nr:hypothetical protein [Paenibacillus dendritiformis]GIO71595.1 hypothetical protein J27TS7_11090 [Paenibacillus dendritiformis]